MKSNLSVFFFLALIVATGVLNAQYLQQGGKLVGDSTVGPSNQSQVAISSDGNTAIVGGTGDNGNTGAVWIFIRSGGVWTQQGPKLVGTGAVGSAKQGSSVAISSDGNTVIWGGFHDNGNIGAVWVFTRTGGVWTEQGSKLVGTGAVGSSWQGVSIALSSDGNTAIVGGFNDNTSTGAVWVFTRSGGVWTQQGPKLIGTGDVGFAHQGSSVAISLDGNTVIWGGYSDNGNAGAVWVFTQSGGVWTQQGPKLVGTGAVGSAQQNSVALSSDGNTAVVGGFADNTNTGAVWIFTRSGGVWTQQGPKLVGSGAVGFSGQGNSVSVSADGNTVIVGGDADNGNVGAIWVFARSGSIWAQLGQKLIGTNAIGSAHQGVSVAISSDGNTFVEGGELDNGSIGALWVFIRSNYRLIKSHNNLNKGIQGNQTTLDTITIVTNDLPSYYVSNVIVSIDTINYPSDGDLEISLIHATNTDTLVYQVGGSGSNFIETVLSDSATILISNGNPPFTGNFKPSKPLSQFLNFEPSGEWILKVFDRTTGQTGTLEAWTLTLDLTPNPISVTNISKSVPKGFGLFQNYPNPFNPSTKIKFDIPPSLLKMVGVRLVVYDILGREVAILVNEILMPGIYSVEWNAKNYSSGVYFYKLTAGDFTETKRMVLLK